MLTLMSGYLSYVYSESKLLAPLDTRLRLHKPVYRPTKLSTHAPFLVFIHFQLVYADCFTAVQLVDCLLKDLNTFV